MEISPEKNNSWTATRVIRLCHNEFAVRKTKKTDNPQPSSQRHSNPLEGGWIACSLGGRGLRPCQSRLDREGYCLLLSRAWREGTRFIKRERWPYAVGNALISTKDAVIWRPAAQEEPMKNADFGFLFNGRILWQKLLCLLFGPFYMSLSNFNRLTP